MTALNIWRSAKPTQRIGTLQPMSRTDALAWRLTRELHPHLYERNKR